MLLPIYDTHFYIGFLVLIWLSFDSYRRYRKNNNASSLYIALASICLGLSMFCWGFPSIVTSDTKTLSLFTFIGDTLQAASFLFLWLLSIRALLGNKPKAEIIANSLVIVLAVLCIVDSISRNLFPPYTTTAVAVSATTYDIIFTSALSYSVLTAINSLSLFLLSFYFWKQGNSAPNAAQKIRIKSLAVAFFFTSVIYIALPAIPLTGFEIKDIALTSIFLVIAISAAVSHFIVKQSSRKK